MLDYAAALGAGTPLEGCLLYPQVDAAFLHVGLDRLGNRIGAGEHLVVAETGRAGAGDAERGAATRWVTPGVGQFLDDL